MFLSFDIHLDAFPPEWVCNVLSFIVVLVLSCWCGLLLARDLEEMVTLGRWPFFPAGNHRSWVHVQTGKAQPTYLLNPVLLLLLLFCCLFCHDVIELALIYQYLGAQQITSKLMIITCLLFPPEWLRSLKGVNGKVGRLGQYHPALLLRLNIWIKSNEMENWTLKI